MMLYITMMKRDLRLSLLRGCDVLTTLFFFVVTASLFAFAFGGEQALIQRAASGIIWVSAVLSSLLSLEAFYHRDAEDGTFDLMLMAPVPPLGIVLSKMLAHWLSSGLSLVLMSLVLSQMLFVPQEKLLVLLPSLLMGTLYMSVLGGMGAVLTFGAKRPALLLTLLVMPLYIPMLLLGVMAYEAVMPKPYLLLQLALALAVLPLVSWAAAAFMRMNWRS